MPHPDGGRGNDFRTFHTFEQAFAQVTKGDVSFLSTTGEKIIAKQGLIKSRINPSDNFYR